MFLSGILADLHPKVTLSKFAIPEIPGVGLLNGRDSARMANGPLSYFSVGRPQKGDGTPPLAGKSPLRV
jgi:hypothetical protein